LNRTGAIAILETWNLFQGETNGALGPKNHPNLWDKTGKNELFLASFFSRRLGNLLKIQWIGARKKKTPLPRRCKLDNSNVFFKKETRDVIMKSERKKFKNSILEKTARFWRRFWENILKRPKRSWERENL